MSLYALSWFEIITVISTDLRGLSIIIILGDVNCDLLRGNSRIALA